MMDRRPARPAPATPRKVTLPPFGLSALEIQAADKALGKAAEQTRDLLVAGSAQAVDFRLAIAGELDIGEPTSRIATSTPELVDVLAWLFARLEPREQTKLRGALVAAFRDGQLPRRDPETHALALGAVELVTAREQKPRRGDVRARLNVTRLPREK